MDFNCEDEQQRNLRRVDENDEFRETLDDNERRKIALLEHWRTFHRLDHLGACSFVYIYVACYTKRFNVSVQFSNNK